MKLLREFRFWLFAIVLVVSIISIGYLPGKGGVYVSSMEADSPLAGHVRLGETLQSLNEVPIQGVGDIERWESYTGLLRVVHDGSISLVRVDRPGLGITVNAVPPTNLALGMDLVGGTRVLLEPQYAEGMTPEEKAALAQQIVTTLETRTNVYGLRELPIRPVRDVSGTTYIQIETTTATLADIEGILQKQGKFEAFIPREVVWFGDRGTLTLEGKNHTIEREDGAIRLRGTVYRTNDTLTVGNITFLVRNVTALSTELAAKVFDSEDIKFVHTDAANSYVINRGGGWEFSFGVIVSDAGAQQFAAATADLEEVGRLGERSDCYLSEPIELYLDQVLVDELNIGCSLRGEVINAVQISGGAPTEEDAQREMRQLQTVLKSGSLPVPLHQVRVDTVSPTLGHQFLSSILLAGVLAFTGVAAIVYVRYKRFDVALPMLFISLSEIIMILGVAAFVQWTIDLAAIAGVLASIGTGINDQIVIADEALHRERYTTKERIKRAFFIVFGAAATVIAAMLPLAFIGIGVMRGFAVTTIIGVLVGILITRPFYAKLVEMMIKD